MDSWKSRDVVRDQNVSDSLEDLKHDNNTANSRKAKDNIKVEMLDDNQDYDLTTSQCPISIIRAEPIVVSQEMNPKDNSAITLNEDPPVSFLINEIGDSSHEAISNFQPLSNSGNELLLRRPKIETWARQTNFLKNFIKNVIDKSRTPLSGITTLANLLLHLTSIPLWT